jgi:hypothetical protein
VHAFGHVPSGAAGRRIAVTRAVEVFLITVLKLAIPVVIAYWIVGGQPFRLRGAAAFLCAGLGLVTFYQGFDRARMEDARARYGRVTTGTVVEKLSELERSGSRYIGPRGGRDQVNRRPIVTRKGFWLHERLSRLIATGSPFAWVIAYQFSCDAPRTCEGRDFVSEETWSRIRAGQVVKVREIADEPYSGRLEASPQWTLAFIELGLGSLLLMSARVLSGRPLLRRREWMTAPAVVMRVEPVTYPDATRWRIHFAYFDRDGQAQESADEVGTGTWKEGDDCIAVYRRKTPDLATLRPLDSH